MQLTTGFLSTIDTYAIELPAEFEPHAEKSSVLAVNGEKHTVQFAPASRFDTRRPGQQFRERRSDGGHMVDIYDRPEIPALTIAYWDVANGVLWTQVETETEGDAALDAVIAELDVAEDANGLPRLTYGSGLSGGDLREPAERDLITFYAIDASRGPWSVTLINAGGMARDSESGSDPELVSRATALGVQVTCDGPASTTGQLSGLCESVAGNLRLV
jgi:hypothetical protein